MEMKKDAGGETTKGTTRRIWEPMPAMTLGARACSGPGRMRRVDDGYRRQQARFGGENDRGTRPWKEDECRRSTGSGGGAGHRSGVRSTVTLARERMGEEERGQHELILLLQR